MNRVAATGRASCVRLAKIAVVAVRRDICPMSAKLRIRDHRRRLPDGEKARKTIHWDPRVGLDEGYKLTLHWFSNKKSP